MTAEVDDLADRPPARSHVKREEDAPPPTEEAARPSPTEPHETKTGATGDEACRHRRPAGKRAPRERRAAPPQEGASDASGAEREATPCHADEPSAEERELSVARAELARVLRHTDKDRPTRGQLDELQRTLARHQGSWKLLGNLTETVRGQILDTVATDWLSREGVRGEAEELKRDLGYADASALERLHIDQVVTCWLHLQAVRLSYGHTELEALRDPGSAPTFKQAEHRERQLEAAQRRFERASTTLAKIRKLSRRIPVQVNIAQNQVVSG